jgi:hypothetical protein
LVADHNNTDSRESGGIDRLIDCLESDCREVRRYALCTPRNLSSDGESLSAVRE